MSNQTATYKVHGRPIRIPIARREVRRVVVESSHVRLEFESLDDTSRHSVDLFAFDNIDLGRASTPPHPALGAEAGILAGLLGRRVITCLATPDGRLDLRFGGSARIVSDSWIVALGTDRHWSPQVGGGVAEWRSGEWPLEIRRVPRRPRQPEGLDTVRSLPLAGQKLQAISFFEPGLTLQFEADLEEQPHRAIQRLPDVEVDVRGVFSLAPEGHVIDVHQPRTLAPLLALVRAATVGATASPDGTLEIRFEDGTILAAGPGEDNQWSVSLADPWGWIMAKPGSVTHDEPKVDRPLGPRERAILIRAYLEYAANDRVDLSWSFLRISDLISNAPEDAYDLIRELVRLAPSPYVLGIVGAGMLEDLLANWGERFIERLEVDARKDAKLLAACAGVWQLYMPDDVWDRLQRLVGGTGRS